MIVTKKMMELNARRVRMGKLKKYLAPLDDKKHRYVPTLGRTLPTCDQCNFSNQVFGEGNEKARAF